MVESLIFDAVIGFEAVGESVGSPEEVGRFGEFPVFGGDGGEKGVGILLDVVDMGHLN